MFFSIIILKTYNKNLKNLVIYKIIYIKIHLYKTYFKQLII